MVDFNPHSREGNDGSRIHDGTDCTDFNPRSREGNDGTETSVIRFFDVISIHVPAKGTTFGAKNTINVSIISIHVPAKGTTLRRCCKITIMDNFNPRSREGNDGNNMLLSVEIRISIHVPAKGTTCHSHFQRGVLRFQSTFPRRERQRSKNPKDGTSGFQSTFPRRERRQNKQFPPLIFKHFHLNIRATCLHCALFSLFHLQTHSFCVFFWCESPRVFMFTSGSHYILNISSNVIRPSAPICLTLTL